MLRPLLPLCLVALSACSGATPLAEPVDAAAPVDVAAPSLTITAAIASASLADDCETPDAGAGLAATCARPISSDGGAGDSYCAGAFCQQTSLQLTFAVTAIGAPASVDPVNPVTITSVRLLDATTGSQLDTLTPRAPQRWIDPQYVTWDSTLRGYGETRTSFRLSAPDWNRIGSGNARLSYGRAFQLEVTVVINGETRVLRSGELMRAPEVVT